MLGAGFVTKPTLDIREFMVEYFLLVAIAEYRNS
jgi:hypothetical protein